MSIFLSCTARLPEWTAWFNVLVDATAREGSLFTRASSTCSSRVRGTAFRMILVKNARSRVR